MLITREFLEKNDIPYAMVDGKAMLFIQRYNRSKALRIKVLDTKNNRIDEVEYVWVGWATMDNDCGIYGAEIDRINEMYSKADWEYILKEMKKGRVFKTVYQFVEGYNKFRKSVDPNCPSKLQYDCIKATFNLIDR